MFVQLLSQALLAAIKHHARPVFTLSHNLSDFPEREISKYPQIDHFPVRFLELVQAFFPVSEETFLRAKQMLDDCDACICALTEFGPYNEKNRQLYEYAKKLGKVCAEI